MGAIANAGYRRSAEFARNSVAVRWPDLNFRILSTLPQMTPELCPPDQHKQLLAALRLSLVAGVGPRHWQTLVERFGSPDAVLAAAPSELRSVSGIGPKLGRAISAAKQEVDAERELELCRRHGIEILIRSSAAYPKPLVEIPDPPAMLFIHGSLQSTDAMSVAIVGSRHATHYGKTQAERLAGGLARAGLTVVSGLARGIDAAGHRGALAAGGRTLAVLGSGVLNIYPPEHRELALEVQRRGALISEAPPQSSPLSGAFPQRNRIISGLSLGSHTAGCKVRSSHSRTQTFAHAWFACSA
ncbi:MAG TPA: DNA-processing protein DprA [Pirellulales bacterium]|nr:DNA-processing protein DprA [Pirellulales bacterium]